MDAPSTPLDAPAAGEDAPSPLVGGVSARFLTAGDLPLAVLDVPEGADAVLARLEQARLVRLPRFVGARLPRPVGVAFDLADDLTLWDERGDRLVRAPAVSIDRAWVDAARRLRGTMLVAGTDLGLDPDDSRAELARRLDAAAADGRLLGGIAAVSEQRPRLPIV